MASRRKSSFAVCMLIYSAARAFGKEEKESARSNIEEVSIDKSMLGILSSNDAKPISRKTVVDLHTAVDGDREYKETKQSYVSIGNKGSFKEDSMSEQNPKTS
ncbi:uncharacterized protein NEMAJ01_0841 [Nematocida major]|uniref:uncharacterized protein n=1 Tax=Nematocida major TaxID=1912982 RepID=UPI00200766A0|nr:uncharacterized protein NEMAJ01_0841 [Nematocida major]KAH9385945.1 hypothetical protein NEMAJ01_0841 [Nematocida major]